MTTKQKFKRKWPVNNNTQLRYLMILLHVAIVLATHHPGQVPHSKLVSSLADITNPLTDQGRPNNINNLCWKLIQFASSYYRPRGCIPNAGLKPAKSTTLYLLYILIQAGDIEPNPGPRRAPKYPCQVCSKAVKWGQRAVQCDHCDGWYHVDCMAMTTQVYQSLANNDVSWICSNIGCCLPNFSSTLFNSLLLSTSNSYSGLTSTSEDTNHSQADPNIQSPTPSMMPCTCYVIPEG